MTNKEDYSLLLSETVKYKISRLFLKPLKIFVNEKLLQVYRVYNAFLCFLVSQKLE
jgi:hypothetical protein